MFSVTRKSTTHHLWSKYDNSKADISFSCSSEEVKWVLLYGEQVNKGAISDTVTELLKTDWNPEWSCTKREMDIQLNCLPQESVHTCSWKRQTKWRKPLNLDEELTRERETLGTRLVRWAVALTSNYFLTCYTPFLCLLDIFFISFLMIIIRHVKIILMRSTGRSWMS